jgi:hypothetical protein
MGIGRRSEEDYEEPNQRLKPDLSDCRRPANHPRNGAGGVANDDVLSVCRVSHTVSATTWKKMEGEQCCRFDIDRESKNRDCVCRLA